MNRSIVTDQLQVMEETLHVQIKGVNPHIVCSLCAGYFIDATTITECLHTFCKSCIVKYLQSSKACPQCGVKIHETMPTMSLRPDRTMQDIVFKLVPTLFEDEEKRKQEFYKSKGFVKQKKKEDENAPPALTSVYDNPKGHYFRTDEQICMCLERFNSEKHYDVGSLPKKFVRCSARTCVFHIQHLLRKKLNIPLEYEVEVLCDNAVLQQDMTLKHIKLSRWSQKPYPLILYYRATKTDLKPENRL